MRVPATINENKNPDQLKMGTELVRARSHVLLYDVMLLYRRNRDGLTNNSSSSHRVNYTSDVFSAATPIQVRLMSLVESSSYLLTTSTLSSLAIVPYLIFIAFTLTSRSLLRPKNVFKSNFAFSAIIHLVRNVQR